MPDDLTYIEPLHLSDAPEHNDSVFVINFSREYHNMEPIDEMLFRASLVYSMTDLDFINNVEIRVEDESLINSMGVPWGVQNRINIDIEPEITTVNTISRVVKLYFADETGTKLLTEERRIDVNVLLDPELFVVEQIIEGPRLEGHFPTISSDVKILDVQKRERTLFINLSADFINKRSTLPITDEVAIYSIVNSVKELRNVNNVQFLIESENVTEQWGEGSIDISRELGRNEDIVADKAS
jgi:germination protein M